MSDEERAGAAPEPGAMDDRAVDSGKGNSGDGSGGSSGSGSSNNSDAGPADSESADAAAEAAERDQERERERAHAAGRFREHTRDPLAEDQGEDGSTDLAAASRARRSTRKVYNTGRDLTTFDRTLIGNAHIGDINLRLDGHRAGTGMRTGPVPEDELRRIRRIHVEPKGYVQLRDALSTRRLLVLVAAPGTGRTSTALSLLDEVTRLAAADAANAAPDDDAADDAATADSGADPRPRVSRVNPVDGVRKLRAELTGSDLRGGTGSGYLLKLPVGQPGSPPPDTLDLDGLAAELAGCRAFAVIVVTAGAAANPLLAGRYGMLCPPVPTSELLATRLRERLEDHLASGRSHAPDGTSDGTPDDAPATVVDLLRRAEKLAERQDVKDAVGLADLRPAEAELLASLLAGHLLAAISEDELLAGCRSLAAGQAREWFAGVDRALAAPATSGPDDSSGGGARPRAATLFHPVAFRIALAVLGGASHSAVASAAHLLTWELSVQSDPDHTPARPLFCDDPDADALLSRAELTEGRIEVAGAEVPARLIRYRGSALPAVVLSEVWDQHFPVRAPLVRWLRLLADDPRPQVWMRAAVATGELCVRDFDHGYAELIRPLAEAATPRRRIYAATTLDQAAGHATHRKAVRKLVDDWSRYGTKPLRWTAAMALGYGNAAASTDDTLAALARIGVRDKGDQLAIVSLNVVRLLTRPDSATVLRAMAGWTHHRQETHQDLGLVTTVRFATTAVAEVLDDEPGSALSERADWPLPLALAATRPDLVPSIADLLWTALNTPRSQDVAMEALAALLRSAVRRDGTRWTRPGLAALLPALMSEDHDRRRLDWLLRRMMDDPDNPLPDAQARTLWWLAVPPRDRTGEEDRNG
ncbi:hypothetical protein [Streptomyces sp. NPDC093109]|uniref:hypothetical protein n=1 Tax=Streptomyces sp. NPDC093109 TaxID=3154977 RepID=UPI0034510774